MFAAECGRAALALLAFRGLPIDREHQIYVERVPSLPTALFSGSEMPVCADVVACDVDRLLRFLEGLADAELAVLCAPAPARALVSSELPCAVVDALDAHATRVGALCARLVRRGAKRARRVTAGA
jgi:hypothetical protein